MWTFTLFRLLCLPPSYSRLYELSQMYSSIDTHILNAGTVNICFICQTEIVSVIGQGNEVLSILMLFANKEF